MSKNPDIVWMLIRAILKTLFGNRGLIILAVILSAVPFAVMAYAVTH